jgi:hypothetical protein
MKVVFESRDPDGARLRDLAVARAQFVMRRLTWLVPRAKVHLDDVNGPRGGVDKRCHVEIRTRRVGTVVITALARDWRSALEDALSRAARVVVRNWKRANARPRPRRPALGHQA